MQRRGMNVLLIGGGGREHAMRGRCVPELAAGMNCTCFREPRDGPAWPGGLRFDLNDQGPVRSFSDKEDPAIVVVGPRAPWSKGCTIASRTTPLSGVTVIGPRKEGARLEGARSSPRLMLQAQHPDRGLPAFRKGELTEAIAHLDRMRPPYVLKVDGLAAGRAASRHQRTQGGRTGAQEMLEGGRFRDRRGARGDRTVPDGVELSAFRSPMARRSRCCRPPRTTSASVMVTPVPTPGQGAGIPGALRGQGFHAEGA